MICCPLYASKAQWTYRTIVRYHSITCLCLACLTSDRKAVRHGWLDLVWDEHWIPGRGEMGGC